MIPTLQIGQMGLMRNGAAAPTTYNGIVDAANPLLWWKIEETSGTTAVDSSGNSFTGTLDGGATFASAGVSVSAVSGFAGIGKGVNFSVASTKSITSVGSNDLKLGTSSTGQWTLVIWAAGSSGSGYLLDRQNDAAVIYQFVSDTVEFFALGYTGTDPRTGSGLSLPAADTTTPHMFVYRYNNGTWAGFKNGTNVFSVSRSFALASGINSWKAGSDGASSDTNSRVFDIQCYNRALSDAEILAFWNARDSV